MKHYALIGYPLGHSLSPQIHTRLFNLSGIDADYVLKEISPEDLNDISSLSDMSGFNVTIPHKIAVIPFCDKLDITAERYGSVNCVKNELGAKTGYNTDVLGFVKSVEQMGATLKSNVILLGCGGVGRMMALETLYQGGKLTMAVRREDVEIAKGIMTDAKRLIANVDITILTLDELSNTNEKYDLLVNATPVGMHPKVDFSPVDKRVLSNVKFLFDAIYNPRETLLMKQAKEVGVKVQGGMAMLVLQAVAAHEIWNNSHFEESDIFQLIADMEKLV